jgi:hypothetical protein
MQVEWIVREIAPLTGSCCAQKYCVSLQIAHRSTRGREWSRVGDVGIGAHEEGPRKLGRRYRRRGPA